MSSKFNIELAQGTVTVEGDEEFIKSVYQALQATLLSGDAPKAKPVDTEAEADKATKNAEPEIIPEESAPEESVPEEEISEEIEATVTPIKVAETGQEPASLSSTLIEEGTRAPIEDAEPEYEPIPSVLDPDRAEREKAEAEEEAEEARLEPAPASRGSVLEQIKESLGDDEDSGSQTSILQRIRDSLSEDRSEKAGEAGEAPRAADAS